MCFRILDLKYQDKTVKTKNWTEDSLEVSVHFPFMISNVLLILFFMFIQTMSEVLSHSSIHLYSIYFIHMSVRHISTQTDL